MVCRTEALGNEAIREWANRNTHYWQAAYIEHAGMRFSVHITCSSALLSIRRYEYASAAELQLDSMLDRYLCLSVISVPVKYALAEQEGCSTPTPSRDVRALRRSHRMLIGVHRTHNTITKAEKHTCWWQNHRRVLCLPLHYDTPRYDLAAKQHASIHQSSLGLFAPTSRTLHEDQPCSILG